MRNENMFQIRLSSEQLRIDQTEICAYELFNTNSKDLTGSIDSIDFI